MMSEPKVPLDALDNLNGPHATESDYYALAQSLRQTGNVRQARETLNALNARFSLSGDLRFQLEHASTLSAEGQHDQALTLLETLRAKYPSNHHAFVKQAETLVQLGRYDQAAQIMGTVPLAGMSRGMVEHVVFLGVQLAIYIAGRADRPSFSQPTASEPFDRAVIVMMVRDEADIIGQNLSHHYRLGFRKFSIILNCCQDKTPVIIDRFIVEHPDAIVCTISDPVEGYYQAGKTQAAIEFGQAYFAAVNRPVDWCFVLDADEFLCLPPNQGLTDFISSVEKDNKDFIALHLCDATSDTLSDYKNDENIYDHFDLVVGSAVPVVVKTAFRTSLGAEIAMGNHSIYFPGINLDKGFIAAKFGARLVHLPYRSKSQVKTKIVNGGSAYEATKLDKSLGAHWRQLYRDFLEKGDEILSRQMTVFHQRTVQAAKAQMPLRFR